MPITYYNRQSIITFANNVAKKLNPNAKITPLEDYDAVNQALRDAYTKLLKNQSNNEALALFMLNLAQLEAIIDSDADKNQQYSRHILAAQFVSIAISYTNKSFKEQTKDIARPKEEHPKKPSIEETNDSIPEEQEEKQKKGNNSLGAVRNLFNEILNLGDNALQTAAQDKEVQKFLSSSNFNALKNYQNFLTTDPRSHSYFFGAIDLKVEKAEALNGLINGLKRCEKEEQIKAVLKKFYETKDVTYEDGTESLYSILNKGQNITTRALGFFGMRTTTIELIDKLAAQYGLGNDAKNQQAPK